MGAGRCAELSRTSSILLSRSAQTRQPSGSAESVSIPSAAAELAGDFHERVARAQEMLGRPELSPAEIALVTGFSDQSHFARHFGQTLGITPGQFRWSQR